MTPISIGITTRNRPNALRACLQSIARVLGEDHDVIVFDDHSAPPAAAQLDGADGVPGFRIIDDAEHHGYIVGRNELVRQARHEFVLLLDDDTVLLDAEAVRRAVQLMEGDPGVAAIAFAQAEADGRPWPAGM